jgi:D-aspartate ligase
VAECADRLGNAYQFQRQPEGLAQRLCSKKEMHALARSVGVPTPLAVFPSSRDEVEAFAREAQFPVMLKGIHGKRLEAISGRRMFLVRTKKDLLRLYSRYENPANPNLMIQEHIPGGEKSWMFNGYFNSRSECLLGFTGTKLHQFPVYTGLTSLGACVRNPVVYRMTCDFMRAIGYKGILDMEYSYDPRDGQYKVLDVNPRIGATFRLFVGEDGMDVARALYFDFMGWRVMPSSAPEGRRWMIEDLDLISCLRYAFDGRLTPSEWMRSYRGVKETAMFAADDPLPALAACAKDLVACARRAARNITRLPQWNGTAI